MVQRVTTNKIDDKKITLQSKKFVNGKAKEENYINSLVWYQLNDFIAHLYMVKIQMCDWLIGISIISWIAQKNWDYKYIILVRLVEM